MNKVTIKNMHTKRTMTYTLVSENEADLKSGKIAVNTPIAQGLLGKKVGDIAEIVVPSGTMTFEVIEISI
jgi:transcription elongation factor GreA